MPEKARKTAVIMSVLMNGFMVVVLSAILWNIQTAYWHELVWLALFIGMSVIRMPFGARYQHNQIANSKNNGLEKLLLFGMFLGMGLLPLIYLAANGTGSAIFNFADYHLPPWFAWIGTGLVVPFLLMFWRSHADLGQNWSPKLEIHTEHQLVTQGVYRRIRHPMYLAIWFAVIAQTLLIHNWIAGFLTVPIFLAMYLNRISREEEMMREQFGAAYDAYTRGTGRIIPKFPTSHDQYTN